MYWSNEIFYYIDSSHETIIPCKNKSDDLCCEINSVLSLLDFLQPNCHSTNINPPIKNLKFMLKIAINRGKQWYNKYDILLVIVNIQNKITCARPLESSAHLFICTLWYWWNFFVIYSFKLIIFLISCYKVLQCKSTLKS